MPGSWPEVPLSDLCSTSLRNGVSVPKSDRGEGPLMVNMGELFSQPRIRDSLKRVRTTQSVSGGAVPLGRRRPALRSAGRSSGSLTSRPAETPMRQLLPASSPRSISRRKGGAAEAAACSWTSPSPASVWRVFAGRHSGSSTAIPPRGASMSTPAGWLTAASRRTTVVPSLASSFGSGSAVAPLHGNRDGRRRTNVVGTTPTPFRILCRSSSRADRPENRKPVQRPPLPRVRPSSLGVGLQLPPVA